MAGTKALLAMAAAAGLLASPSPRPENSDITPALEFSNIGNCAFSAKSDTIFTAMLRFDPRRNQWVTQRKVRLGRLVLEPRRTDSPKEDVVPGGAFFEVSAAFPDDILWHGLKIRTIRMYRGEYPESDSVDGRQLVFDEPVARVQAVLKQLGANVPVAPDFRELDAEQVCGGAMSIAPAESGSVLDCNWGC